MAEDRTPSSGLLGWEQVQAEVIEFVKSNPSCSMEDLFDALSPAPRIHRSELRDALSHLLYVQRLSLSEDRRLLSSDEKETP